MSDDEDGAVSMSRSGATPPGLLALVVGLLLVASTPGGFAGASEADPTPSGVMHGWWSQVQNNIRNSEYHVTWQNETRLDDVEEAWHAPNRAHDFRIYFTRRGIRVIPRTERQPAWQWGLELIGYGRDGNLRPVSEAQLSPDQNRIEYDRGDLVEWYVNDHRGLEQGFTLLGPPERGTAPIHLLLALSGTLSPRISAGGQAIDFVTGSDGRVVRYAGLKVLDAGGSELPAWLEGFAREGVRGIRLVVDDTSAIYPITIDPLATSPDWTAEGDSPYAEFGFSVATAGDVNADGYSDVIVGAPGLDNGQAYEGGAFLYHGSVVGLPVNPTWAAESDQQDAYFGRSVATAGDVNADGYADVIVGADFYDQDLQDEGGVFVYHGSATGMDQLGTRPAGLPANADWAAEGNLANSDFGYSVATAGDVDLDGYSDVIVGAPRYANIEMGEGGAFVYHGSSSGLDRHGARPLGNPSNADWVAEGNQVGARFGESVSTAGYVNGDAFADVIVGAPNHANVEAEEGRAYVYHGSLFGLSATPAWIGEGNQASAHFGQSVSTAGDVNGDGYADVIVGALGYQNVEWGEGAAFVYHGSFTGLSGSPDATPQDADWSAEGDQETANLGDPVATAGDVNGDGYGDVIVGAARYDNDLWDEGAAFVFLGSSTGMDLDGSRPSGNPSNADWSAEGDLEQLYFGDPVATAGDVDGDGYADVMVGAPDYSICTLNSGVLCANDFDCNGVCIVDTCSNDSQSGCTGDEDCDFGTCSDPGEGRVRVYNGSASGLDADFEWHDESNQEQARFGVSVATAGDVNGDGHADVIVGAYEFDNGETDEGQIFVYHGSNAGLSSAADWKAEGDQVDSRFGGQLGTAGDVNGDGFSDVIVGAGGYTNGQTSEGGAFVYYGSPTGLDLGGSRPSGNPWNAEWSVESDQEASGLGAVATAGDVNGDGYSDVIVGDAVHDGDQIDEGFAFVFHGSRTGLTGGPHAVPADAQWFAESNQGGNCAFAARVGTAGDVNRDGFSDVIIGAYFYDNDQVDEGSVFVYHGSPSGLNENGTRASGNPGNADWTAESDQTDARFGVGAATAGDVNGDGYADIIISTHTYDNGQPNEGAAFVFHGSPSGLDLAQTRPSGNPSNADWTAESDEPHVLFGRSAATAGDVNGDGYADVIVGCPRCGSLDEGRAYAFHGSAAGLSTGPDWLVDGPRDFAEFGIAVGTAGDVNGDGYADALVGAWLHSHGEQNEGRAYVYHGNGGLGLSLEPRQRRVTDIAPIAHLGGADAPDRFLLALVGSTPFGRGKVKLEREVEPLERLLDGLDTKTGADWHFTGPTAAELHGLETGLIDERPYHWRLRLRYNPVTTPFAQHSRWLTMPWNGWQEADLRTGDPAPAGRVPGQTGWPGQPLSFAKAAGSRITLTWGASCLASGTDYAIYEGALPIDGTYTHEPRYCSTAGQTERTLTPLVGDTYYLVVPVNPTREGSHGVDGSGGERPQGFAACLPQWIGECPGSASR